MTNKFTTSDLIKEIRSYQVKNPILLEQPHHFVFDCPFDANSSDKPKYIWIGLNPGDDTDDWDCYDDVSYVHFPNEQL